MSQEKVDRYKQEKANRKAILKKEKRMRIAGRILGIAICAAIVGWIGYSVYDSAEKKAAATKTEVKVSAITDYLSGLTAEDTDKNTDQDSADTKVDSTDQDSSDTEGDNADKSNADGNNADGDANTGA